MHIMGIDVGNTCAKASVFDHTGSLLTTKAKDHGLVTQHDAFREISTVQVIGDIKTLIRSCTEEYPDIDAVAVTCMSEAIAALDKNGAPLTNSLLTHDMRAQTEATEIIEAFGEKYIKDVTGLLPNAKFTAPKLLWIAKHEEELFTKARYFSSWIGIICRMFGFAPHCDYAIAGKTMMFDIRKKRWDQQVLSYLGIDAERLETPVPAGTQLGRLSAEKCAEFGFCRRPMVVMGSFDQACVNIGSGICSDAETALGMGTVFCMINNVSDACATKLDDIFPIVPDILPDRYITTASVLTGAQAYNWAISNFYGSRSQDGQLFKIIEKEVQASKCRLIFFPYLAGSGTPTVNPNARGTIFGLATDTNRGDMMRAVMEGIAFEMRLNIERIELAGSRKKKMILSGGCSRSEQWAQIMCDVLNRPSAVADVREAGSLGAAIIAAFGAGVYPSLEEAIEEMTRKPHAWLSPKKENAERVAGLYEVYKMARESVMAVSEAL